jgi:hypothetical protein
VPFYVACAAVERRGSAPRLGPGVAAHATAWLASAVVVMLAVVPWSAAALGPMLVAYAFFNAWVRPTLRELQRLDSTSRSPLAATVAESIRSEIVATAVRIDGSLHPLSVSVGVAELSAADGSFSDLFQRTNEALTRAKLEGRNRSITALTPATPA